MEETLNSFQNDFFREMRQRFALFLLPYELLKERIYSCSGLKLIGLDISTFLGLKQQRGEEKILQYRNYFQKSRLQKIVFLRIVVLFLVCIIFSKN